MNHRMQPWSKTTNRIARRAQRRWCGALETLDRRELLATFTVTNPSSDPLTPGSLAWAITQSNADTNPDADIIDFSLGGVAPYKIALNQALPAITKPVTIDGTTQPGYDSLSPTPVVQITGEYIGIVDTNPPFAYTPTPNVSGFVISTGNADPNQAATVIKGLSIGHFTGAGVDIQSSSNVVIQGVHIGADTTGLVATPNCSAGVVARESTGIVIGGTTDAAINVISGNGSSGIVMIDVTGATIQGNRIGVDRTGHTAMPNHQDGINLTNSSDVLVGIETATTSNPSQLPTAGSGGPGTFLTDPAGQNLIAANGRDGVVIWGPSDPSGIPPANIVNKVVNNKIGYVIRVYNSQGFVIQSTNLGNGRNGVNIGNDASGNLIQQNLFDGNHDTGVVVATGNFNALFANEYFANTNLGIDLGYNGSTPNDFLDADLGANFNLNYPTVTSALSDATKTTIQGTYSGEPNKTFNIQVYTNPASLSLAPAQGRTYLGYIPITTDASGVADFTFITTYPLMINEKVTTIASDLDGNTSEISGFLQVQAAPTDVEISLVANPSTVALNGTSSFTATVTNLGDNNATGVVITMTIPVGFTITGTTPAGLTIQNNVVTANIPFIPVGQSASIVVDVIATQLGTFSIGSSVTLLETDSQPSNNQTSVSLTVNSSGSSSSGSSSSNSGSSGGTDSSSGSGTDSGSNPSNGGSQATPLIAPHVTSVRRVILGGKARVVLTFDQPMDPVSTANASNYYFATKGRDRKFDTSDDRVYGAVSAVYDPTSNTVVVTPYQPRGVDMRHLRVTVLGVTNTAVESAGGAYLDGQNIGKPSNFNADVPVRTQMMFPKAKARATRRLR